LRPVGGGLMRSAGCGIYEKRYRSAQPQPPFSTTDPTSQPHPTQSNTVSLPGADMAGVIDVDLPGEVQALHDELMRVPERFANRLPLPTITISALLALEDLPPRLETPRETLPSPESCITDHALRWTDAEFLRSPVPKLKWFGPILTVITSRLILGHRPTSLRHPSVDGLYLPLWVAAYWESAHEVLRQRKKWKRSADWLRAQEQLGEQIGEATGILERTQWGRTFSVLNTSDIPFGHLADMVSDRWLSDRHFDVVASWLTRRGQGQSKWWFGHVYFSWLIKRLGPPSKLRLSNTPPTLKDCYRAIVEGRYTHLLFPAHVDGDHWIAYRVDLEQKEFCYGAFSRLPGRA
jgi:hypothetical protein